MVLSIEFKKHLSFDLQSFQLVRLENFKLVDATESLVEWYDGLGVNVVTFQLLMIVSIYKVVLSLQTSNGLLVERIKVMKGYFRLATLLREAKV